MNLPIPEIRTVKECYQHFDPNFPWPRVAMTLIAPDPNAGRKARYSVLRIVYETGKTTVIGRELDLRLARRVARRSESEDGKPLPQRGRK